MPRNSTSMKSFYPGQTVQFTSTAKRGRPEAIVIGVLERLHRSQRGDWWELSSADGRNWRVPEGMAPYRAMTRHS